MSPSGIQQDTSRAPRRRFRPTSIAVPLAAWAAIVAGLALTIAAGQDSAREELRTRFELRADLAGRFVESFIDDVAAREHRVVGPALMRRDGREFARLVKWFGFDAAVLLDRRGRLVHVDPPRPEIVGRRISDRYAHLAAAVRGRVAVSNVVASAARGVPVVAVAVPYADGVFSGAFAPGETPIGAYLRNAVPLEGSEIELVDRNGVQIATNLPRGRQTRAPRRADDGWIVVERPVAGTPWRVRAATPERELYAPLAGFRHALPWLILVGLAAAGLVAIALVRRVAGHRRALVVLNEELDRLAHADALTGLYNRRHFDEALGRELERARRQGHPVAVLVGDIDDFKRVNDTAGHRAGDLVLQAMAERWRRALRGYDLCSRWGGDELAAVLPGTDAEGAAAAAERVRALAAEAVVTETGVTSTTMSLGWAVWEGESAAELLGRADAALYAAKRGGRNRTAGAPA